MAQAIEYAARLTETIGARPAGTEEEQQASFFIDEVLREEAGLATEIEEFNCNLGYELPRTVCCIATAVLGILSIFLTLMVIPSVIITLITAILFILDSLGRSPFARFGNSGISQNILAKYTPQTDAGTRGRKRKVLVIAHYDSGKVRIEAKGAMLSALPYLYILELVGMALVPVALLIRFVSSATAGLLVVLNVLTVIGVVLALIPVFGFLIHQTAQYNRGANVNASGVAVLLECAKRVGEEPEELMADAVMHGEEELRAEGLIPEDVELTYSEAELPEGELTDSVVFDATVAPKGESLADAAPADAAVGVAAAAVAGAAGVGTLAGAAAMPEAVALDPASDQRSAYTAAVSQGISEPEPEEDPNVPDWYRKAMQKANKHEDAAVTEPVHRSKFADALDNANAVSANAIEQEEKQSEVERRLAQMRASIMGEAGAPGVATAAAAQAHAGGGVDGYLSSMTDASNYEDAAAKPAVPAAAPVTASGPIPVSEAEAQTAAEEAAAAAAAAAQAAAVADKTISYIPVEVDAEAMARENAELKQAAQAAPAAQESAAAKETAHGRKRRTIDLPSLTGAIEGVNARLQNAPLAEEETSTEETKAARRQARQERLAHSLPPMDSQDLPDPDKTQAINTAGSFVSASATSTFNPVGEELIADVREEDLYIEDADDSDYASDFTATGAPAGPGYVEMPKSRASRMFGRFRRKKKSDDVSMSEAYGLDESWDARSAGAARGGWESFRDDAMDVDDWEGGAFSKVRQLASRSGKNAAEGEEEEGRERREGRSTRSGARRARRTENPFGNITLSSMSLEEREIIQQFHSGPISCEVWFLAVGAELANNAGIKSFLTAHADELRGAIVIDLDGLGTGQLSLIEEDGIFQPKKPSARMKRYVNKAASTLGVNLGKGKMRWRNSGAYCTAAHGLQTLHIAGMEQGKPAYAAQADDVMEHISEEKLAENAAFVIEVLRQI